MPNMIRPLKHTPRPKDKSNCRVLLLALILLAVCMHDQVWARQGTHYTFFSKSQFPLKVHYLEGEEPGPTIMVQGGVQGDERSGFLSAQLLTEAKVKKGNLIIVPRANVPAVLADSRQVNVDLNRRFDRDYHQFYEDILARAIRHLVHQSDALIHLHEGSGFYHPTYINKMRNPGRFGQSVIIDMAVYNNRIYLARAVKDVLPRLNSGIVPAYQFQLFNTRTHSTQTNYPEQKKALTYYTLKDAGIPAVAIEVSKDIHALSWKIRHQIMAAKKFLEKFGVDISLPDQIMKQEVISDLLHKGQPVLEVGSKRYKPGEKVKLYAGQPLNFSCRIANDEHSLLNPRLGLFTSDNPHLNLLYTTHFAVRKFESLRLVADGQEIAKWSVNWYKSSSAASEDSLLFVCSLNNQIHLLEPGEELVARQGDHLVLLGIWGSKKDEVINLKGYLSHSGYNDGQDKGREVILDRDFFISRYLLPVEKNTYWRCEAVRETEKAKELGFTILVLPSKADALRLASATGGQHILPLHSKNNYALSPGVYTLSGLCPQEASSKFFPVIKGKPRNWGVRVKLEQGEEFSLDLYHKDNFRHYTGIKASIH